MPHAHRPLLALVVSAAVHASACAVDLAPTDFLEQPDASLAGPLGDDAGDGLVSPVLEPVLADAGYWVGKGAMHFFYVEDCAQLPTCYGNNPSSPYGLFRLPPSPGHDAGVLDAGGLSGSSWALRADEAVLLWGTTPPKTRYFGFTPYLFSRFDGAAAAHKTLFASVNDTLNQLVLSPDAGSAFGQRIAVVASPDEGVSARVVQGLSSLGVQAYPLPLPGAELRLGLGPEADRLSMLFRVAMFEDTDAGATYLGTPPFEVFRLTPRVAGSTRPFGRPHLRSRDAGTDESSLEESLRRLELSVRARHAAPTRTGVSLPAMPAPALDNGFQCIERNVSCLGDNRDTPYLSVRPFLLPDGPDDFVMVVGVNHRAVGMATYSNLSAYHLEKMMGVRSVADDALQGSADSYLPNDPNRGLLYVLKVSRRCAGEPSCLEVPVDFPGVPLDGRVLLAERAYLHPALRVGVSADALLAPRAILYVPR